MTKIIDKGNGQNELDACKEFENLRITRFNTHIAPQTKAFDESSGEDQESNSKEI